MTPQPITDTQVRELPVHEGRADLLAEIMATPVASSGAVTDVARRSTRGWVPVAAAAAVVVTVAGVALWRGPQDSGSTGPDRSRAADQPGGAAGRTVTLRPSNAHASQGLLAPYSVTVSQGTIAGGPASPAPEVSGGAYVALGTGGWSVASLNETDDGSDLFYVQGDAQLDLTTYPAADYATYVADRDADAHGSEPLTLLDRPATMWTYGDDDHTVIRSVDGDRFLEVRGTGMSEQAFRDALADLVQTDAAGFGTSLPAGFVTPDNRDQQVTRLLRDVDTPSGFDGADVHLAGYNDPYQAATQVANAVGCAWLGQWSDGTASDRDAALAAFDGSRHWPLLVDIRQQGDYAQGFWQIAGELRADAGDGASVSADVQALEDNLCS